MCKQTVVKETKHYDRYGEISLAEFIEFFARLANKVNKDESLKLAQKIGFFMDRTFPVLLKAEKIVNSNEQEEESESDDEYGKEEPETESEEDDGEFKAH